MKSANDTVARIYEIIDIGYVAYRLGIGEDLLYSFCIKHEKELLEQIRDASLEIIENHGYIEGALDVSEPFGIDIPTAIRDEKLVSKIT